MLIEFLHGLLPRQQIHLADVVKPAVIDDLVPQFRGRDITNVVNLELFVGIVGHAELVFLPVLIVKIDVVIGS